jgi:hypothetical protein
VEEIMITKPKPHTGVDADRLFDGLKQAKSALDTLATADLSEDDLAIVVPTVTKFFDSVQSAANYLAVLRKQRNA